MTYTLSRRSLDNLKGVHPDLVAVVKRAIEITRQDFMVFEGLRTLTKQREYVARGVSQTLNSKHLPQADGYGHAVDLVPWIAGGLRWEHEPCQVIAEAVRRAAQELGVSIKWGGAWHIPLTLTKKKTPAALTQEYIDLRRSQGRKPFVDSAHFEVA